jgi:hypothetical protein
MYFLFDRKLLSKLSQCVWKVLSVYLMHTFCNEDADPGAVIAIQSFGDFLGFHPHAHVLITDGGFYGEGAFRVNPAPNPKDLGFWLPKRSPPPTRAHAPPQAVRIDYLDSQIPSADDYLIGPDRSTLRLSTGYPADSWTN